MLELPLARLFQCPLERVAQRRRARLLTAPSGPGIAIGWLSGTFGWWWVGRADDRAVLARCAVKRFELAVGDPDEPGEELVQPVEIPVAEDLPPDVAQAVEDGRVDDAVVGACLQVHGRAAGRVARQRPAGDRFGDELFGEGGEDHVGDGHLERVADEPSGQGAGRVLAHAVGFHARLLDQPPVDSELPLGWVR